MPRMDKLSNYRTTVANLDDALTVTYVDTPIVIATDLTVTLNSGGYQTVTTKRKMNQASNQFGLGYGVYQKDHDWFVTLPSGVTVEFEDGMFFAR